MSSNTAAAGSARTPTPASPASTSIPATAAPRITDLQVNKTSGGLPLHLSASIEAKDPEDDALTYVWHIGKTLRKTTTTPSLSYTLSAAGDYPISVEVRDGKSKPAISNTVGVYAGNEAPTVGITLKGNKSFYFPETPIAYSVTAKDKEDKTIVKNNLIVTADYLEGSDKAAAPQGHQVLSSAATGRNIMMSLDCKTCHKPTEKSIGPAFRDVAIRYQKDPNMVPGLTQKIKKGGSGKWGEVVMPAHPDLKDEDIRLIIGYIQSLAAPKIKSLPATGTLKPTLDKPEKEKACSPSPPPIPTRAAPASNP
ncbi:c-type cytochrome [Puia sp. P3]|uniref:c-type cytochrome n=1 Tax=Puia sp. P3 TaxID=3423952 RepID=UPI003D66EF5B